MKFDYKDSAPIPTKASWQRSGTAADNEPTDALKALLEVADPYKYARQTDTVEQSETFLNGKFPGGSLTEETISKFHGNGKKSKPEGEHGIMKRTTKMHFIGSLNLLDV